MMRMNELRDRRGRTERAGEKKKGGVGGGGTRP